jgi:hypothetical protein
MQRWRAVGGWLSSGDYGDLLRREEARSGSGNETSQSPNDLDHIKNNWSCIVHELMEKIIFKKKL